MQQGNAFRRPMLQMPLTIYFRGGETLRKLLKEFHKAGREMGRLLKELLKMLRKERKQPCKEPLRVFKALDKKLKESHRAFALRYLQSEKRTIAQ